MLISRAHLLLCSFTLLLLCTPLVLHAQWEPDVRLTFNDSSSLTSYHYARCLAVNGDSIHAVWFDTRVRSGEIYYLRSWDGGVSWWPAYRLTNDPGWSAYPAVAVWGPSVHVVWDEGRDGNRETYYCRSTNSGAAWGPEVRLTWDSAGSGYPSVAAWDSTVHAVWWDNRDGNEEIYYKRSRDGGSIWGADVRLSHGPRSSGSSSIAVEGSLVFVAWGDEREGIMPWDLYYTRSTDGGETWAPDIRLTDEWGDPFSPSVAVSCSTVHVVWEDRRDGNYEVYYKRSSDGGVTWNPDTRLTYDPASSSNPSVAASGRLVHIVWEDGRTGGPTELFYKRSVDGGNSWSLDFQLTNAPWASQYPTVAVALSRVHVLWSDQRDGNWEIYYKRNPTGNSGVEESSGSFYLLSSSLSLSVLPNPFTSFATVPGHSSERFALYDISGRRVGVYRGDRIGADVPQGVYFVRAESGGAKPVRVVKVR